jgi:hypothetical protein
MNKNENLECIYPNSIEDDDVITLKRKSHSSKIKNVNLFLFNENNLSKYSWEIDGERVY